MNYCADSWFLLELIHGALKANAIFREVKERKSRIVIPAVAIAETTKLLLHRGKTRSDVVSFFTSLDQSDKISIVSLDKNLAIAAGAISISYGVPLIDSIVATTAHTHQCEILLAKDSHYAPLIKKKYVKLHNW